MNLTKRPVFQKGQRLKKRPNRPTAENKRRWNRIVALGCVVANGECQGRITIHHLHCGSGGRKDHDRVAPLCWRHHLGDCGVNSLTGAICRRAWETMYMTEHEMEARVRSMLGEQ